MTGLQALLEFNKQDYLEAEKNRKKNKSKKTQNKLGLSNAKNTDTKSQDGYKRVKKSTAKVSPGERLILYMDFLNIKLFVKHEI